MGRSRTNSESMECFLSRVVKIPEHPCWEWVGSRDVEGYGRLHIGARGCVKATRLAWKLFRGEVPSGMVLCHSCDNPSCVNPDHLWPGTHAENQADRDAKKRARHGDRHYKTKIPDALVGDVERAISEGRGDSEIARDYGVHRSTIWYIRKRRSRTYATRQV